MPYVRFSLDWLGERAIPYLARLLREDRDEQATQAAIGELGEIGTAEAYDVLALAFDDPHSTHRYSALYELYVDGHAGPKYLPKVSTLLLDPSDAVRQKAAEILGVPTPAARTPAAPRTP